MAAAPPALRFRVEGRSGDARAGLVETPHGAIHTPAFMPVGTHGAVKAMTPEQVRADRHVQEVYLGRSATA